MLIRKAYRYRLYPTADQEQIFAHNFGQVRFVHNHFLAERKAFYEAHKTEKKKGLTYEDNANALILLKKDPQYVWLKIGHSQVLQQSLKDLDTAYQNFFKKRAKFPKFRKKSDKQSCRYMQYIFLGENWVDFPKIGKVKAVIHRACEGKIKNVTVTKTKSGRYFASVQVELEMPEPTHAHPTDAVGVDLGLKSFLVTSDSVDIAAPKYLRKAQERLTRLQRQLSRRKKESKGREKARLLLARQHEKVAHQRSDFLHKASHKIMKEYGIIGIEDLNVAGMVKNHKLARSISDVGWGEFRRQLVYKAQWNGAIVVVVDRFFPSTRRCSDCGYVLPELKLEVREWDCPVCGKHHLRDENSAVNLKLEAQRINLIRVGTTQSYADGEGVSLELESEQSSAKSEAARSLA
jgi:putative transposase